MAKLSKRRRAINEKVELGKLYPIEDALNLLKDLSTVKFPETVDVATAVANAKAGQVRFRADKNGIVHGGIGIVSFDAGALKQNLEALMVDLSKAKPASAKGIYVKKVTISSTMGPGLLIDQASLEY